MKCLSGYYKGRLHLSVSHSICNSFCVTCLLLNAQCMLFAILLQQCPLPNRQAVSLQGTPVRVPHGPRGRSSVRSWVSTLLLCCRWRCQPEDGECWYRTNAFSFRRRKIRVQLTFRLMHESAGSSHQMDEKFNGSYCDQGQVCLDVVTSWWAVLRSSEHLANIQVA